MLFCGFLEVVCRRGQLDTWCVDHKARFVWVNSLSPPTTHSLHTQRHGHTHNRSCKPVNVQEQRLILRFCNSSSVITAKSPLIDVYPCSENLHVYAHLIRMNPCSPVQATHSVGWEIMVVTQRRVLSLFFSSKLAKYDQNGIHPTAADGGLSQHPLAASVGHEPRHSHWSCCPVPQGYFSCTF